MTKEEAKKILACRGNGYSEEDFNDAIEVAFNCIPSIPSDLDEAAEEELDDVDANWQIDERDDGCTEPGYNQKQMLLMFRSGAEWMAGQGITVGGTFHHSCGYPSVIELNTYLRGYEGKEVIVQIRKK